MKTKFELANEMERLAKELREYNGDIVRSNVSVVANIRTEYNNGDERDVVMGHDVSITYGTRGDE